MALRRLLSGWLIAMAALARSLAQALERASEDRSAPTPDPVMAALAERYPGAPAHWLAHVAERTSHLAETGQAPFSLDSDSAAWPQPLPDGAAPRPLAMNEAAPPRRVEPAARDDGEVPSLAALRNRPSEVWRRPDAEPRRRPRPVFAAAASSEKPARPATVFATTTPRPRARLTVVNAERQPMSAPEPAAASRPVAETIIRPTAWSEAPPPRAARDAPKVSPDLREAKPPPYDHVFAQVPLKAVSDDPPKTDSAPAAEPSAPRRRRAWFFASSPAGRLGRRLDLSPYPGQSPREGGAGSEGGTAADPPPHPAFPYSSLEAVEQTVEPEKSLRALTPPNARRPLFQALAALRARPRPDYASQTAVVAESSADVEPRDHASAEPVQPPSDLALNPSSPVLSERSAPTFSHAEARAPLVAEGEGPRRSIVRNVRRPSGSAAPGAETQSEDKRPTYAAPRSTAPRSASRRFLDTPSDDRWPALPPTVRIEPVGVEAPPPRWDQLAREQEEGRWSV